MYYMLKVKLTTTTMIVCNILSWMATAQAFGAEETNKTVEYESIRIPITMFFGAICGTIACTWFLAKLYNAIERRDLEMKMNFKHQLEEQKSNEKALLQKINELEDQLNNRGRGGSD